MAQNLSVKTVQPVLPEVTTVDMSKLLYYITWPVIDTGSALVVSLYEKLKHVPGKMLLFRKYHAVSPALGPRAYVVGDLGYMVYDLTINIFSHVRHNNEQALQVAIVKC